MSIPNKSTTKRSSLDECSDASPSLALVLRNPAEAFRVWFFDPTTSAVVQSVRYGAVGACAFCCDFGTLALTAGYFKLHYLVAATLGFCVGVVVNYWLSIRWVFNDRKLSSKALEFLVFALVGIGGVGLNGLVMWLLTDGLSVHYLASKILATAVVFAWNFSIRKALIF